MDIISKVYLDLYKLKLFVTTIVRCFETNERPRISASHEPLSQLLTCGSKADGATVISEIKLAK